MGDTMHYFVPRRSGVMPVCNQDDRVFRGRPLLKTRPKTVSTPQFRSRFNSVEDEEQKEAQRVSLSRKKQQIRDDARRLKLKKMLSKAEGARPQPLLRMISPPTVASPHLVTGGPTKVVEAHGIDVEIRNAAGPVASRQADPKTNSNADPFKATTLSPENSSAVVTTPKRGNTSQDMAHILSMTGAEVYLPCILGPPRVKVFQPVEFSGGVASMERKSAMDGRKAFMQKEIDDSKSLALKLIQQTMAADAEKKKADYKSKKERESKVMKDCLANMQDNKDDQERVLELKRIEGLVGMAKKTELDDESAFTALEIMEEATDAFIKEPRFNKAFPHELKRVHEGLRRECKAAQKVVSERIRDREANALKDQAMKIKLLEYAQSNLQIAKIKAAEQKTADAELKAYGKSVIARGQKKQIALDEKMARKKQEKLQFGQMIKDQAAELLSKRDTERKEKYGGHIVNLGDYVDTVGGSRFFVHAKVPPSYYESQGGLKQFSGDPPGYMYKDPWPRIVVSLKVVCFQHLQSHV